MEHNGFIIKDFSEFHRVRVLSLNADTPLDRQDLCPACRHSLWPVVSLVGFEGKQRIHVGGCDYCGYIGYIDRPVKEWIVNFYATSWDTHIAKTLGEVRNQSKLIREKKSGRIQAVSLVANLNIPRNRTVCEIGCGYGNVLRYFRDDLGFQKVVGVENSQHRSNLVQKAFDIPVFTGNFESKEVQNQLQRYTPFGLIFSHHVLEHTYNPEEVISSVAQLQQEGDYFILAIPDVAGEHGAYGVFYLPHLHAFSKTSIEILLNRYGYEVVKDYSPDSANITLLLQKKANLRQLFVRQQSYMPTIFNKLEKSLGVKKINAPAGTLTWLVPHQKLDDAQFEQSSGLVWHFKKGIQWAKAKFFKRYISSHAFFVSRLTKRYTDDPIEIQFENGIQFLMK